MNAASERCDPLRGLLRRCSAERVRPQHKAARRHAHQVVRGRGAEARRVEDVRCLVELVGGVNVAAGLVDGGIRALVLAVGVTRGERHVWQRDRGRRAGLRPVLAFGRGRCSAGGSRAAARGADITHGQFDLAVEAARVGRGSELRVGHVEPATGRVDRQVVLVQEAAEEEAHGAAALRARAGHDRLAAVDLRRGTRSGDPARVECDVVRRRGAHRWIEARDVEVRMAPWLPCFDAGVSLVQVLGAARVWQAAFVLERGAAVR